MGLIKGMAAACMALAVMGAAPDVDQEAQDHGAAEKIHKLDIMLMVSSLRCRHSSATFEDEYDAFNRAFGLELVAANRSLEQDFQSLYGEDAARLALDRMRVGVANAYGQGHPWLDCDQLKEATSHLLVDGRPDALTRMADELLGGKRLAYEQVDLGVDF